MFIGCFSTSLVLLSTVKTKTLSLNLAVNDRLNFLKFYSLYDAVMPNERWGMAIQPMEAWGFEEELLNYISYDDFRKYFYYVSSTTFFSYRYFFDLNFVEINPNSTTYSFFISQNSWYRDAHQWSRQTKIFSGLCLDFLRRWVFLTTLNTSFPLIFNVFFDWIEALNAYYMIITRDNFWYYFNNLRLEKNNSSSSMTFFEKQTMHFLFNLPVHSVNYNLKNNFFLLKEKNYHFGKILNQLWFALQFAPFSKHKVIVQLKFDILILFKLTYFNSIGVLHPNAVVLNGYCHYLLFLHQLLLHSDPTNKFFDVLLLEIENYYFVKSYLI